MNILLGLIMPLLVDLANKKVKSSKLRFWVAIGFSMLAAAGIAVVECIYDTCALGKDFFADAGVIFASSQIIYKQFWSTSIPRETYLKFVGDTASALKVKKARAKLS